jgi:type VI secretion system protein ImpJ
MGHGVVWQEGLFLRPQHFQQNDRYYAYELMNRTKELGSNMWGFFNLNIDADYLKSSKIVINNASGIMPDGTLFDINSKDYPLSLNIKLDDISKSIYLALPITIQNSDEVSSENQKNRLTRYVTQSLKEVTNSNVGEDSLTDVLATKYNFKLLLEEEINEGYVKIKLGTIGDVSASGIVSLENDSIPTYLHLNASKSLIASMDKLLSTISYRIEKLAEKLSDSNVQASELGEYLMLQLLNKTRSRLHFYFTQDRIHPDKLFLELTSFIGELAIFMKKDKVLSEEFVYEHENQGSSFLAIISELNEMLSMVLEQKSISLPVEKRKYGIHIIPVVDRSLVNSCSFVFAVKSDLEDDQLKKLLLSNLKMGSNETIRDLVNYHLGGYKIKALSVAPRQIPYKVNYLYFKVELGASDKEKVMRSGGFAFHLSTELANVEYAFWAIRND